MDDPAAVQALCDRLGPGQTQALLDKWLQILPGAFTDADRDAGYRYEFSILQAEFSLTQMLDRPVSGRVFFEIHHSTSWRFDTSTCMPMPKDLPSSPQQHGRC